MGKFGSVRDGVVRSRISIAEIEMEVVITERFQVFSQPQRIREGVPLRDLHVEGRPAPPSKHVVFRNAAVVQLLNRGSIALKLGVVIGSDGEHQAFRRDALAVRKGQLQFN